MHRIADWSEISRQQVVFLYISRRMVLRVIKLKGRDNKMSSKVNLLSNTPLSFEINLGQRDERAKFLARGKGYTAFFSPDKVILGIIKPTEKRDVSKFDNINHKEDKISSPENYEVNVFGMKLEGCNPNAEIIGEEELLGKVNYFKGNDPSKWVTNISTYAKIRYKEIYPGIDLVYYGNKGQLEHDFIIKPGANPNDITLSFEGIEKIELDDNSNLLISIKDEQLRLLKPKVYQDIRGAKKEIDSSYNIKDLEHVSFKLGDYNREIPLIIDPVLIYSTYLGGSSVDAGYPECCIAVDNNGSAYVAGRTSSSDFPLENPYQDTIIGSPEFFVTKFTEDGTGLVYSTYLGGSDFDDVFDIAVDDNGSAYVTGMTNSSDFPLENPYQDTLKGYIDVFITKLTEDGSGLVYSTYLGGSIGSFSPSLNYGRGIAVDNNGNASITGATNTDDFPLENPYQDTKKGQWDVFVTKLTEDGTGLVYSTYLGGAGHEFGYGIAVDNNGSAYVIGDTSSSDFPLENPYQDTPRDIFVTKFTEDGTGLVYSTYLGGGRGRSIAVDNNGNAYVTGYTSSDDFPLEDPIEDTLKGERDVFVTKLTDDGTELVYSTYLGGSNYDEGYKIAVDKDGNAYVIGCTDSDDFPLVNPYQDTRKGSDDAFVIKLGDVLTPQDKIRLIIDKINDLVTNGALKKSKAKGLIAKLNGAIKKIDKGNNNPAINQLNAFINQVNGFINAGKLSSTVGQELIDDANDVINQL